MKRSSCASARWLLPLLGGSLGIALALTFSGCERSPTEPIAPVRVLLIGNSLLAVNETPLFLQALADSAAGVPLELRSLAIPGMLLRRHWEDQTTRNALANEGPWDLVVLQEAGVVSDSGRVYLNDYLKRFRGESTSPMALMTVWAPRDEPEYFGVLRESAEIASAGTGVGLIPVGEAWRAALQADPSAPLYQDEIYPSVEGAYLNALVLFQRIYGRTPRGLPSRLRLANGDLMVIDGTLAGALQDAAAAAAVHAR
jgi:hypothetical protein